MRRSALVLCLAACRAPAVDVVPQGPPSLPPQRVVHVVEDHVGVLVAASAVDVGPRLAGKLLDVTVRPGDRVRAGDVLARVDAAELVAEVEAATAALEVTRAETERARLDAGEARENSTRTRKLHAYVSEQDSSGARYQEKHADVRVRRARAELLAAEARVRNAERRLGDAEIRAPFAGAIALRYAEPGAAVTPTSPVVRLISSEHPQVRFAVPEARAAVMTPGDRVHVQVPWLAEGLTGAVEAIAPEVDGAAGLVFVEARLVGGITGARTPIGTAVRVRLDS